LKPPASILREGRSAPFIGQAGGQFKMLDRKKQQHVFDSRLNNSAETLCNDLAAYYLKTQCEMIHFNSFVYDENLSGEPLHNERNSFRSHRNAIASSCR